eukprot:53768_1
MQTDKTKNINENFNCAYDDDSYHIFSFIQTYNSFTVQHLLSLMIYCNWTKLQYQFSKTYRQIKCNETKHNVKKRHSNYFWLGKYLKDSVNRFGDRVVTTNIKKLYHGIG